MKEASGELNMTVITLVAVAAVGALFYLFVWPMIQRMVATQTCKTYGVNWVAVPKGDIAESGEQVTVTNWWCCPKQSDGGEYKEEDCVSIDSVNGDTPSEG